MGLADENISAARDELVEFGTVDIGAFDCPMWHHSWIVFDLSPSNGQWFLDLDSVTLNPGTDEFVVAVKYLLSRGLAILESTTSQNKTVPVWVKIFGHAAFKFDLPLLVTRTCAQIESDLNHFRSCFTT